MSHECCILSCLTDLNTAKYVPWVVIIYLIIAPACLHLCQSICKTSSFEYTTDEPTTFYFLSKNRRAHGFSSFEWVIVSISLIVLFLVSFTSFFQLNNTRRWFARKKSLVHLRKKPYAQKQLWNSIHPELLVYCAKKLVVWSHKVKHECMHRWSNCQNVPKKCTLLLHYKLFRDYYAD